MFKSIKQKGLEKHLEDFGVSYKRFVRYLENGAKDVFIADKLSLNRHTVAGWRKRYAAEQREADKQVESLKAD